MQKRVVPFLIIIMSFSLIGIIFIQFKWIQNTLNEKQSLINNQVQVMLTNVEERLADLKGLELINSRIKTITKKDSIVFSQSSSYAFSSHHDSIANVKIGVYKGRDNSTQNKFIDEVPTFIFRFVKSS